MHRRRLPIEDIPVVEQDVVHSMGLTCRAGKEPSQRQTYIIADYAISVMFPRPIYPFCLHHNCRNAVIGPVSNGRDHTVSPEPNTAVGHRCFREGPRNRRCSQREKQTAKRIRNLWNDGKFDVKIGDCCERRTSSCAVLFSSGRGYRLYAVRIIKPCLCDFRKQIYAEASVSLSRLSPETFRIR